MEVVKIDGKYTYTYQDGHVEILRYGESWISGHFPGVKAWIAAAGEIQRLRDRLESEVK